MDLAGVQRHAALARVHKQRSGLVHAGGRARAAVPADRLTEQRVALAPVAQHLGRGAAGCVRRGPPAAAPSTPSTSLPSSSAVAFRSGGNSTGRTFRPMPSTAQPSCGRPSTRIPHTLRSADQHVVGPLDRRLRPAHLRHGDRCPQRQQLVRGPHHHRHQHRRPGRRLPGAVRAARARRSGGRRSPASRAGAPAAASSRASRFVEPVSRWCTRGAPIMWAAAGPRCRAPGSAGPRRCRG